MLDAFEAVRARVDALALQHRELRTAVQAEAAAALGALVERLVPSLEDPALADTGHALGCVGLNGAAARRAVQDEERALCAELDTLEAAGGTGSMAQRLAEVEKEIATLDEYADSVKSGVNRRLSDPAFSQLLEDQQEGDWFRLSFYRRARHADDVVRRHGQALGVQGLDQLLERHRAQVATLGELRDQRSGLIRQRALLRSRMERHRVLSEALQWVEVRHLAQARQWLAGELQRLDPEQVRVNPHVARVGAPEARQWCGQLAKLRYLDGLRVAFLERIGAEATTHATRLAQLRGTAGEAAAYMRADLPNLLMGQLDHLEAMVRTLVEFHAWDRFDGTWPLWWDVFFDGAESGTFLEEVAVFRAQNRDRSWNTRVERAPVAPAVIRPDPFHVAAEKPGESTGYLGEPEKDEPSR